MDTGTENCTDETEAREIESVDGMRPLTTSQESLGEYVGNPDVGQLGAVTVLTEGVKAERAHGHTNEDGNSTEEAEDDDANDTDDSDSLSLNYELEQGYRILKELMAESNKSVNWPFIYKVDDSYPETSDYYEKIKNPIWLDKMKEKFAKREYETITQFIADFRLMLENCYRYNGPDHYVSKRGQKLETMMEQKLALLSREIREKTSIAATSGQHYREGSPFSGLRRRTRNIIPHDSTALLNQLREEEAQSLRDARKQQMLERKAAQEAYLQDLMGWESKMMDNKDTEMRAMWELPQIGLFLFLCQEPLNIGEISQFELERCFFMPRESSTMHLVMTSLLSTPFQRTRIDHKSLMSYRVWEEKLRVKLALWYKVFTDFNKDMDKAADKLGLDPYFFQVVGKKNPMEKKKFHELGVYKRIWIVKSLCEWCLENQESLRDTIEAQPVEESRCYLLGTDAKGNSYIHFPQFCGADLRIYKQAPLPDPTVFFEELIEKHAEEEKQPIVPLRIPSKEKIIKKTPSSKKPKKKKLKHSEIVTPPTNRPSRLRQKIKTVLPVVNDSSSSSSDDDEDDTAADDDGDDTVTEGQSDSAFNDSGISENTPAKRKKTHLNKRISRVLESELYSDSSSVDSENSAWRRRSSRLLKNGLMKEFKTIPFDMDLDETSCEKFDSVSENGLGMSEESRTDSKNVDERSKNNSTPMSDATEYSFNNSESGDENKIQNSNSVNSKNSLKDSPSKVGGKEAGDNSDCDKKISFASCSTVDAKGDNVVDYKKLCDAIDSVMSNGLYGDSEDETSKDSSIGFSIDENAMNSDIESQSKNGLTDNVGLTNTDQFSIDIIKKENCELDDNILQSEDCLLENNVCDRTASDKENNDDINVSYNSERTQNQCSLKHEPENPSCDSNNSVCNDSNLNLTHSENLFSERLNNFDKNNSDLQSSEQKDEKDCTENNENCKIKQEEIDDEEIEYNRENNKESSGSQEDEKMQNISNSDVKEEKNLDDRCKNYDTINQGIDIKAEVKGSECLKVKEEINSIEKLKDKSEHENEENESVQNNSAKKENEIELDTCNLKKENDTESETTKIKEEELKEESEDEEEELAPEIGAFELIVQDVEGLRKLVEEFAEPEPVVIGSGKKQKVIKPPPRRKCVKELYERLLYLLKELEPWESKLLQATKKARVKLRKEHEEYKEPPQEENDDFWKTDNSDTETDVGSGDDSDDEMSETDKSKSSVKTAEHNTTTVDQESYEMDVSSRGRLRKRRVIPNNVEDQAKKRKVTNTTVTTSSEHLPNILQRQSKTGQSSSLVTNLDQLKVLNIGGGIGVNSSGQILLQTTNTGNHALVTGLTPQAIASLRLGTKGTVIVPSTQQMKMPQKSQTQARLMTMTSKQASHPVIQGLLSTHQPNILQKTGTNKTRETTLTNQATATPINVVGTNQTLTPDSPQKPKLAVKTPSNSNQQNKVQYYAANLNSLPPAVLQQLVKSNSLKLQPGTNQSAVVLLAVNPQSSTGVSKVSTAQVIVRNTASESQGIATSVSFPSEGKNTTLLSAQNINVDLSSQQQNLLTSATNIQTTDMENQSVLSGVPTAKLESLDSVTSKNVTLNQNLCASGVLKSVVSSMAASQQQNLTVITTSLPSPSLQSGGESIVTNAITNLSSGTILTSSLGPLSPNRSANKYSGSVTVKSLLEARKDAMRIEAQRQLAMKRVPPVVSTILSPQQQSTPLRIGGVQPVSIPSVVGKRSTVVLHPTTSGIKALKLPSKSVLDSAVQAVVTSVMTSLPTANIKVPSPVTMPSIQRRKNVTKTIMSMKAPIPTTPKVETKLEASCASVSSTVANSPIVTTSGSNQTILTPIPSGNNQYMLANVKKNSVGGFITNSYTIQGQNPKNLMLKLLPQNMVSTAQSGGVLQGYLTPQGIVISQASANPTTPQKSATLVSDGMQVINQNFQSPASTACTISLATSSSHSNSQTTTVSVTNADSPKKQVDVTSKAGILPGTVTFSTNSIVKGVVVTKSLGNSKMSATKSATTNMAAAATQLDFKSLTNAASSAQESTKKDISPVIASNGSLIVNNIVGSQMPGINISGQNISASVPQIANLNPVPQSPVQLTSPVIGQVANQIGNYVPAAVLGQLASQTGKVNLGQLTGLAINPNLQIASQQTLPVVSGNQLIGQPSLHVVGQQVPNIAHILGQAGLPLTNASQVLSQNVFTVVSTPQVTSQSVVSSPNSATSYSQTQPFVEQQTRLSLATAKPNPVNLASSSTQVVGQQFGNIATPLLSPALKHSPVVMGGFGPGSSSELMKQLAAAQILGNSQVQLAGLKPQSSVQTNLSAVSSNVPCSVTASAPSQYYIQIPAGSSAAAQNVAKVQGHQESGQSQQMLLMSPQRGILQGNAQLTAQTKPITVQPGTPQSVINVSTSSNLSQVQKQVQGQVTIPKVQLNFDVKPLVTIVPNSTNATTSVVSNQGLPVVSSNAAGFTVFKNKVFISPSKLSTEATELKNVDTKVPGIRPTLVAKPTNKQQLQQQQHQQQPQQPGTQQGQKLILYNIGGNLVTPQGVQVTVENGVLKVVPKSKINIEGLTATSQTQQGALISTSSCTSQTLTSGLHIAQDIGSSSQAAATQILTNSAILAPPQDQHSTQQSAYRQSGINQKSCEINSVQHGNLIQVENHQNPDMKDNAVNISLCDNNSVCASNVTSKSFENQGTKRPSTDTPEQETNPTSPKISKIQHAPSHLSGSHLKISQILAQKSSVMAVPKSGSGIVRLNIPTSSPVSPPLVGTTRNPGFVVVPGQTQVIFPHSNLSGVSGATAAKQLNVPSSHTGKVVSLHTDMNAPSIYSQTAPNIMNTSQITNSANSSIATNSTSKRLITVKSANTGNKNMASLTDTVQKDGSETAAMTVSMETSSVGNNKEATGEQEAALNLLSLANQGFGT